MCHSVLFDSVPAHSEELLGKREMMGARSEVTSTPWSLGRFQGWHGESTRGGCTISQGWKVKNILKSKKATMLEGQVGLRKYPLVIKISEVQ